MSLSVCWRTFTRAAATIAMLALASSGAAQPSGAGEAPPPAVVVERIEVQPVSAPVESVARVEAIEAVDVRARVQGFLQTIGFQAGQTVEVGDLLFEIEPDQYEAALSSAQAQVSQAEAARREAQRTLARNEELAEQQSVSRAVLDEARADAEIAAANLEAARAGLRTAQLDLSYTRITAPIAGEIGRALFTRGNLVGPESGPLARIIQLDPVRVVFSVSEGRLVTLRQLASEGNGLRQDALRLRVRLPNGTEYPHAGRIEYIASEVNPQTGTVPIRVVFPNPERMLTPNQNVTLIVQDEDAPRLPVVPQTAVLQDRQGRFVFVLGDEDIVTRQRIETGTKIVNGWGVTEGLDGGELVVVQGIQRLSDGARVQPTQSRAVGTGG